MTLRFTLHDPGLMLYVQSVSWDTYLEMQAWLARTFSPEQYEFTWDEYLVGRLVLSSRDASLIAAFKLQFS